MTMEIKSTTSPTLASGAFDTVFGNHEKVISAIAMINEGFGADGDGLMFQVSISISGVTVTTTILKVDLEQATDADRDWEAALTANVASKTITIIADCI